MFNLNDIIGSVTEFMSSGVQETEIVQQITENLPQVTENLPEVPGLDNILPKE